MEPNFTPWVGTRYDRSELHGLRILILGESHYCGVGEDRRDLTARAVSRWGKLERHPFFTVIAKLILGKGPGEWLDDEARSLFWDQVAFYNYIQERVGDNPRMRPTGAMWERAPEPYRFVLRDLRPQLVVSFGTILGRYVDDEPTLTTICRVGHPAGRGFSYSKWSPVLARAIRKAKL